MNKFYASRQPLSDKIELSMIYDRHPETGGRAILKASFESLPEGEYSQPSLVVTSTEAQNLMDELWNCGLRPSEGSGSAGAFAATQAHLEDMRWLTSRFLTKILQDRK